ncbi:MAG TPA: hypothetical protein VK822_12990 [Acetobacteraceae bacterium]|nr:hypothetical protein [Acetobacteraceae bacterium]
MDTINEIRNAAGAQRRGYLTRVLPIAAGLALALASATAHAQTKPSTACTSLQKAGEGESAGTAVATIQKAGEGEGGDAVGATAQRAAAATPCKS